MAEAGSGDIEDVPPAASLSDKIEWLIQNLWPADAPPPRNNLETAAAIASATGEDISSTTVWKLRTGRQDNPQFRTLTALATFFGVPIGYFGFATESAGITDVLTLRALCQGAERGTVKPEIVRAFLSLSPAARWLVDEIIIAAAEADRVRRDGESSEGG
ncbi:XRE family transcriptional regulator [Actinomadura fibrosa]|uniref:HTH cro/C1-type domain-containing protein n=1 Tax=Actinomadura fibrosa TaxID=111802 RepID=A0ABW2XXF2_9ACTN|nr:XRE family transcriptional regulator [Actinomadura fibrosa]